MASIWFNGSCEATTNQTTGGHHGRGYSGRTEGRDTSRYGGARGHVDEVVRSSVEETLNALLQAEADQICGAGRYERSPERVDTRAGTTSGSWRPRRGRCTLKVPKLRSLPFETAIIERYRRREVVGRRSVGGDVPGGSERAAGRGHHRSAVGHAGELGHGVAAEPEDLSAHRGLAQPPDRRRVPVSVPRRRGAQAQLGRRGANVSVLVAIGVGADGHRQILGVAEGQKEDLEGWRGFLRHLKDRGLAGVQLIISDACLGLVEAAAELFPDAQWQRCVVHFYRNVFSHVPKGKVADVARMLKAIHAQEDRRSAQDKSAK